MIKDILVNLSVSGKDDPAIAYALSAANIFGAHLSAVTYEYDLVVPGTVFGGGMTASLIEEERLQREKACSDAAARFKDQAQRAGVTCDVRKFKATTAGAAENMEAVARYFDLSIFGQPDPDEGPAVGLLIEAALFGAGRPILVVPYIHKAEMKLDRVTVCWDGGRAAARAIADALPFLRRSKAVDLLIVETEKGKNTELPGADMGRHLARHGLRVEVNRISASDIDVGDAILSRVADTSSDLLVMGGYGHSRLREFVLGGVTRHMLQQMTLPILMSH